MALETTEALLMDFRDMQEARDALHDFTKRLFVLRKHLFMLLLHRDNITDLSGK